MDQKDLIKPDILINYSFDCIDDDTAIAVIYVRPDTNIVSYEKAILKGVQGHGKVIYMANLNGKLFIKDALILDHYSIQYKFAIYGKSELAKYPEMIQGFENHFHTSFEQANIIGSFEALIKLHLEPAKLFSFFVDDTCFLKLYGQTIKKISDCYIINYDLPFLLNKYNDKTNIFVIVLQYNSNEINFQSINDSIFKEFKKDKYAPIIDEDKLKKLNSFEQVKRTYHISGNHIKAMYDMIDFVFINESTHISFIDTPLGKKLMNMNITEKQLYSIREQPINYLKQQNKLELINILEEGNFKNVKESISLIQQFIHT
jgi:hypothetical protein